MFNNHEIIVKVLILILLEVGLLNVSGESRLKIAGGLNPYSTGSWVAGVTCQVAIVNSILCLNPYSTGSWVAGLVTKHL